MLNAMQESVLGNDGMCREHGNEMSVHWYNRLKLQGGERLVCLLRGGKFVDYAVKSLMNWIFPQG